MAIVGKNIGLWSIRIDVSAASEDAEIKGLDLWVTFRGMNKEEYSRYKICQSETIVNAERGIVVDYLDEKGKERTRSLSPDAIAKRNVFLDKTVGDCIIDHNFESEANKKMSAVDVWKWIGDRSELYDFVINTWMDNHPFYKKVKENELK
jgi:hypothetical protein